MPVQGNFLGFHHTDILRKSAVYRVTEFISRDPALRVEDRHVSARMDAGVRPACPNDADRLFQKIRKSLI